MKLKYLFISITVACLSVKCSSPKKIYVVQPTPPAQLTIALHDNEEGTILIRSSGDGNSAADAVNDAETKAFNTLLFYGLPSSKQERPMVENGDDSKAKNNDFYNNFFNNYEYRSFIISSFDYSSPQSNGSSYHVIRDIKINLNALRTNLENNNIIRKFGF